MRTRLVAFPTIYIRGFQFSGPNDIVRAVKVVAGPSNSVVIDRQGMYWMTGKVSVISILEACSLIDGLVSIFFSGRTQAMAHRGNLGQPSATSKI